MLHKAVLLLRSIGTSLLFSVCVCVMQERERERESYRFKQLVFSNSVIVNQPGSRTSCDVYGHYVVRVHVFCLPFNSHVKLFEVVAKKHKL